MNTPDPIFSERQARDEDIRAEALVLAAQPMPFLSQGSIEYIDDEPCAPNIPLLLEMTLTEMDRRANEAPETLIPLAGYQPQTPGSYGAATLPYILHVMHEIIHATALPARMIERASRLAKYPPLDCRNFDTDC